MAESDGSDRLDRIERTLAETNQTLADLAKMMTRMGQAFDERQDRIQRHLEVLVDVVDGLIRDRRFKELEKRVSDLEEGSRSA